MEQHGAAVPAISPGVVNVLNLKGGEAAVASGAGFDLQLGRMPRGAPDKFFLTRKFKLHGTAGDHRRERADVFGDDFLFSAEAAADTFAEDPYRTVGQPEQVAKLRLVGKGVCELVRTWRRLFSSIQVIEQCVSRGAC